ncbi:(d)CMP kinase [Anaerotignum sp.]|uniref:(d)CMP kinase n=1 Tax=Anaerotignum sp. TaxID=2039241 RepID=UPI002A916AB1|nr:(d)CMP kinase [Anaerotignum sp.]MCI7656903.1 (d)CMP kinase [Clostridia bacterium]MDY5415066.1 (d)CMP kinase [Anaerotignum sp.]
MKKFAVAVDGPAGSGKSTVAKEIAKALGILYIDTGAMYRTVGMACLKKGIDPTDESVVVASLDSLDMKIFPEAGGQRILLDGEDITSRIRTEEIGKAASSVAAYQKVREKLVEIQQGLAKEQSVIMDGRDIGTKVLPDAEVKIYLDASVEERAKRRVGELEAQGKTADLEIIREEIAQRDYQDMHRENSPLCRADDAVNVDTTGLDIPGVTAKLLALIAEKTK